MKLSIKKSRTQLEIVKSSEQAVEAIKNGKNYYTNATSYDWPTSKQDGLRLPCNKEKN